MNENESWQEQNTENSSSKAESSDFIETEPMRGESREGFRPYDRERQDRYQQRPAGGYGRYNNGQRTPRPRFNRNEKAYSSDGNRGFRPQGFGGADDSEGHGFRPQGFGGDNSEENRGGYQPRGNYQPRGGYQQRGGYQPRPRGYGYDDQQRPSYGRQGGYNPGYRPNNGYQRQGGYQPRPYNNDGYANPGGYGRQNPGYGGQGAGYGYQPRYNPYGRGPQKGFQNKRPMKPNMKRQIEYKEYIEDPDAPIRLNKYLANAGVCSRREADEFIQAGVVKVNDEVVTELGTKVKRTDTVHFHDQLVSLEKKVYVLLNKPKDYVTTSDDPQQRKTVMDLVKNCCRERIYPVGRLDRNTTGVLLFTNDGELASKLTHPKFLKKKIYHVFLDKNVAASDLKQIAEGITLDDGEVRADSVSYAHETDRKQVGIEIHSGKNRIVRRIFESLGYRVCKLDRVVFAGLTKKGLKRGDWRFLTEKEVAMLHMGAFE